mmetsp:Transcript_123527/g.395128  ORF Transcript_123527/g.395128 Transcript_123527/m.395128 type:complete len:374 (-) Transcript_123527:355-1476(-)
MAACNLLGPTRGPRRHHQHAGILEPRCRQSLGGHTALGREGRPEVTLQNQRDAAVYVGELRRMLWHGDRGFHAAALTNLLAQAGREVSFDNEQDAGGAPNREHRDDVRRVVGHQQTDDLTPHALQVHAQAAGQELHAAHQLRVGDTLEVVDDRVLVLAAFRHLKDDIDHQPRLSLRRRREVARVDAGGQSRERCLHMVGHHAQHCRAAGLRVEVVAVEKLRPTQCRALLAPGREHRRREALVAEAAHGRDRELRCCAPELRHVRLVEVEVGTQSGQNGHHEAVILREVVGQETEDLDCFDEILIVLLRELVPINVVPRGGCRAGSTVRAGEEVDGPGPSRHELGVQAPRCLVGHEGSEGVPEEGVGEVVDEAR